jgi:SAM-dependent methyltransferase
MAPRRKARHSEKHFDFRRSPMLSSPMVSDAERHQHDYYARTAEGYDAAHGDEPEHALALEWLTALIRRYGIRSVLDVGSGTGRALLHLKALPELRLHGVEPVEALREAAYAKGISRDQLTAGDATALPFPDGSFDLVCEVGILHHVQRPEDAVREMLRVASKAIFISDSNNFGQGSAMARLLKNVLRVGRLWPAFNYLRTGGRGYHESAGDGIFYSYSVFNQLSLISAACQRVHLSTAASDVAHPIWSAEHVAVFGLKRQAPA